MRATLALGAGAVAAWLPVALAADRSAELEQVVAAERAFAARAQIVNPRQAFVEYFAPDAIVYAPFPAPAFPALRDGSDWSVNIQWRPVAAAISGAGDMGYTTGPSEYRRTAADPPGGHGHYTSVWQRQPDGRFLVRIDIGIDHPRPQRACPTGLHRSARRPQRRGLPQSAARRPSVHCASWMHASVLLHVMMCGPRLRRCCSKERACIAAAGSRWWAPAPCSPRSEAEGDAFGWSPEGVVVASVGRLRLQLWPRALDARRGGRARRSCLSERLATATARCGGY